MIHASDQVYRLSHETDSGDEPHVRLLPLSGTEKLRPTQTSLPTVPMSYEVIKHPVPDFPRALRYNFRLFSKEAYETMVNAADFNHLAHPVRLQGLAEKRDDWFVLFFPTRESGIFDWDKSVYRESPRIKGRVRMIRKWVFKTPSFGFPGLFSIEESPTDVFISGACKNALEEMGATGFDYTAIETV